MLHGVRYFVAPSHLAKGLENWEVGFYRSSPDSVVSELYYDETKLELGEVTFVPVEQYTSRDKVSILEISPDVVSGIGSGKYISIETCVFVVIAVECTIEEARHIIDRLTYLKNK